MHSDSTIAMIEAPPAYVNVLSVASRVRLFSNIVKYRLSSVKLSSENPRPQALAVAACTITTIGMKKDSVQTARQKASIGQRHLPSATGRRSPPLPVSDT